MLNDISTHSPPSQLHTFNSGPYVTPFLQVRNCSLQSRKPVRSLGHTLDLQEIMLLAKNAKSLVYEVCMLVVEIVVNRLFLL